LKHTCISDTNYSGPSCPKVALLNEMISKISVFPVSRKYGHLLSLDLPESKITATTTDKDILEYWSQTRCDFIYIRKKVVKQWL